MILLTGFEPFGGEATNPSWLAAGRAAGLLRAQDSCGRRATRPSAVEACMQALAALDLPAEVSQTAGTYVFDHLL